MEKYPYFIILGYQKSNSCEDRVEFMKQFGCRLHIPSLGNAMRMAKLAGLKHYKVFKMEKNNSKTVSFTTFELKGWEEAGLC